MGCKSYGLCYSVYATWLRQDGGQRLMLCFYGYGLFTRFVPSLAHKIEKARNAYRHGRGNLRPWLWDHWGKGHDTVTYQIHTMGPLNFARFCGFFHDLQKERFAQKCSLWKILLKCCEIAHKSCCCHLFKTYLFVQTRNDEMRKKYSEIKQSLRARIVLSLSWRYTIDKQKFCNF